MAFPLRQIPKELLDPWYDKFEKLYLIPAYPRRSRKWSIPFGFVSIYLGFDDNSFSQVVPENAEELYIFYIHVDPQMRRRGYGTKLMKDIIEIAKEIGYKKISLDIGYLNPKDKIPSKVLRSFYGSFGFKNVKGSRMVLNLNKDLKFAA